MPASTIFNLLLKKLMNCAHQKKKIKTALNPNIEMQYTIKYRFGLRKINLIYYNVYIIH